MLFSANNIIAAITIRTRILKNLACSLNLLFLEKLLKITFENKIIIPKTNKVIMMNINPIIMI